MPGLVPPDIIAVLLGIQENFDVIITDEELLQIRTMGQLYEFVRARVVRNQAQVCVTSATFYRLRRALGDVCGVARDHVRPTSQLEELIPSDGRRSVWRGLQAKYCNLPDLWRSAWLERWIERAAFAPLFLMCVCFVGSVIFLDKPVAEVVAVFLGLAILPVGILGMFIVHGALYRRTEHHAIYIPPNCATVRDMVYTLISQRPSAPLVTHTTRPTDKEIWRTLCSIVGAEFDRSPDSYTRKSRL
jgi:hypothetical protein